MFQFDQGEVFFILVTNYLVFLQFLFGFFPYVSVPSAALRSKLS